MSQSVSEIRKRIREIQSEDDPHFQEWLRDPRKGVQQAVAQWYRIQEKQAMERLKYEQLLNYERELLNQGITSIAGIDEVGRGPLAGPVIAAAVILPPNIQLVGINDSKKLSKAKRDYFYKEITDKADVGIGIVTAAEIDLLNIYEATKKAMVSAIQQLHHLPQHLLIDAMKLNVSIPQTSIVKGDVKSASIAAASIVAKVTRDRLMCDYALLYPQYGFEKNMGYGTKEHLTGLQSTGPCEIHRNSFSPVKEIRQLLKK
ncbi:ribonuclease HII [Bacillus aerolatus]|uniref:Ribonuclease HII n=1 Tax=Bacillus aerolatus TaxID=2653354 RepID=A0A6I1FNK9_9BACI|nr:ribonuclease HII [Bacillus aerolatus]KAB7708034.1 ribonuclease HII [Bacillus aerolatus]